MARVGLSEDQEKNGIIAAFENNKYGVLVTTTVSEFFQIKSPLGDMIPMELLHLMFVQLNKKEFNATWAEMQDMKNQMFGGDIEALELYPSKDRTISNIPDHQSHMWCFPPGYTIPVGMYPSYKKEEDIIKKEDIELCVIEYDGLTEVFGSKEEAFDEYAKKGKSLSDDICEIKMMGEVPVDNDNVFLSNGASKKIAHILEKSKIMDAQSSETVVNTNGPVTDQDELESEYKIDDYAPNSDEEKVMMPEFMSLGIEQMNNRKKKTLEDAVKKIEEEKMNEEEFLKAEEDAKKELEKLRDEMRKN